MKKISVHDLHQHSLDSSNELLIDVRTLSEHQGGHIPGAKNIPLDELPFQLDWLRGFKTVYAHCKMGGRSSQGCEFLEKSGLPNVINVEGGFEAWQKAGFDMER